MSRLVAAGSPPASYTLSDSLAHASSSTWGRRGEERGGVRVRGRGGMGAGGEGEREHTCTSQTVTLTHCSARSLLALDCISAACILPMIAFRAPSTAVIRRVQSTDTSR